MKECLQQMVNFHTETASLQPDVSAYSKGHSIKPTLLAIRHEVEVRSLLLGQAFLMPFIQLRMRHFCARCISEGFEVLFGL